MNKIKKAQRQSKRKITEKFSPSSKFKQNLYLTEGLSAAGSVKQARDSETDAIYALRGKVKNAKKLSDLTNNVEWLDIMSILEIEPGSKKLPVYDKIIIASDEDCIGEDHIVITENGNKKIKDLTYDDKVLTHSGEYKSIEKIIETKKENYIEIEINEQKIICSEYHVLLVVRNEKIQEIFAKNLRQSDFLLLKNE
jgi:hypothetical protein